jgi:hypothetical protein
MTDDEFNGSRRKSDESAGLTVLWKSQHQLNKALPPQSVIRHPSSVIRHSSFVICHLSLKKSRPGFPERLSIKIKTRITLQSFA